MTNKLFYGDNLDVLRNEIASESVDLVYLDPPFNSNANYNILFKDRTGAGADAQIEAFEDTWHWNESEGGSQDAFDQVMRSGNTDAAELLRAMRGFLGDNDMMAYLAMMAIRLLELHRVLTPTGSLYLHCDPTASHYLKLLLDGVFGPTNFLNEIIWKRTSAHSSAKRFGPVHDTILFYSKSSHHVWNQKFQPYDETYLNAFYTHVDSDGRRWRRSDVTGAGTRNGETGQPWRGINVTAKGRHWAWPPSELDKMDAAGRIHWPHKTDGMPMLKRYLDEQPGTPAQDVITDIPPMHNLADERLGYPTQKPLALLERIIAASSNPGDLVLDPFCGCGTALDAAQKLGRRWIGIDVTHLAIEKIERRLHKNHKGVTFETIGTPRDLASAEMLAERDKHQFELWAVAKVGGDPARGGKKGAGPYDGVIYFKPEANQTEKAVIEVKGGGTGVKDIRNLHSAMEREGIPIGIFVTKELPTRSMIAAAAAVGRLESVSAGRSYPRLQIITLAELFRGKRPDLPYVEAARGKRSKREATGQQERLI
ncbi:MAG TPA: DNA methyltransferase [Allosphingosinicella sp.]|nr:DNA methyltransferase [Allosphingosinicella sp.]